MGAGRAKGVHPIAAIALVLLAFVPRLPSGLVTAVMVLLGISIIADIIASYLYCWEYLREIGGCR